MDRRAFLRRTSLAIAGGLVVGPQVMEMYEQMTHKKVFALGAMRGIFNVRDFGAIGDGIAYDRPAVARATLAASRVGGIVYFPAGDYIVMQKDNPQIDAMNVTWVGDGYHNTNIWGTQRVHFVELQPWSTRA